MSVFKYFYSFRMSIFAALAAQWRPPPKPTFETLFRRMSSTRSSSSVPSKSWSSAASSSSSSSGTRRSEHRVNQEPNRGSSDKEVIQSYLEDAVRASSKRTYLSFWRRYKSFCSSRNIPLSAANSIALFLITLAESSKSKSSTLIAKTAIKYHLKLLNPQRKSNTDSYLVSRVAKAIIKKYGKPVKKAKTISSSIVKEMVLSLIEKDFKDQRSAVFFLMQFLLIGRFEEISKIKRENVLVREDGHLEITLLETKNYNVWDSQKSMIAKGEGSFDPVSIIKDYVDKLGKTEWLFPNFRLGKNKAIVFIDKPVSYNNTLKLFREALNSIGLDGRLYSLHSLRTGALSEAANAENVDKEVLQRHGRWKTASMIDYYHEMSLEKRLEAVRSLSIYN